MYKSLTLFISHYKHCPVLLPIRHQLRKLITTPTYLVVNPQNLKCALAYFALVGLAEALAQEVNWLVSSPGVLHSVKLTHPSCPHPNLLCHS